MFVSLFVGHKPADSIFLNREVSDSVIGVRQALAFYSSVGTLYPVSILFHTFPFILDFLYIQTFLLYPCHFFLLFVFKLRSL